MSDAAESELAVVPYVPMVEPPRGSASPRTNRRLWLAAGAVAIGLLAVAAVWSMWPAGDHESPVEQVIKSEPPVAGPKREPALSLVGHTNTIECIAFLPGGKRIVSSDDDQQILVWDLEAGQLGYRLANGDDTGPALAFDPTGRLLATAADNDLLKLWDLPSRTEVARLKGHHVAFSPAGGLLAAALHEIPLRCTTRTRARMWASWWGTTPGSLPWPSRKMANARLGGPVRGAAHMGCRAARTAARRSKTTHKLTASPRPGGNLAAAGRRGWRDPIVEHQSIPAGGDVASP